MANGMFDWGITNLKFYEKFANNSSKIQSGGKHDKGNMHTKIFPTQRLTMCGLKKLALASGFSRKVENVGRTETASPPAAEVVGTDQKQ